MTTETPPGWYPDPERPGRRRWWNGTAWTSHVSADPGSAQEAAAPAAGDSRTWAMAAHLSALVAAFVAMAFLGPLVVYLVKRDGDPFVRQHAAEALNFQLSVLLYALIGGLVLVVLMVLVVGIVLLPVAVAAAIAWLVLSVVAAVRAGRGEHYRYPLTIRFVR